MTIDTVVRHSYSRVGESHFGSTSQWLDDEDLADALKNKPRERLENVKATARRMVHPQTKAVLYELATFAGSTSATERTEDERNLNFSSSQTIKANKRAKPAVGDAPPKRAKLAIGDAKQPVLAGKGREKVEKALAELTDLINVTRWSRLVDACEDLPKVYVNHLRAKHLELQSVHAELTLALSSGLGKAGDLCSSAKAAKDQYKVITEKIDKQISEFVAMGMEVDVPQD